MRPRARVAAVPVSLLSCVVLALSLCQPLAAATLGEHAHIQVHVSGQTTSGVTVGVLAATGFGPFVGSVITPAFIAGGASHDLVVPITTKTERVYVVAREGREPSPLATHPTGGVAFPDGYYWSDCLTLRPKHTLALTYRQNFHIAPKGCTH